MSNTGIKELAEEYLKLEEKNEKKMDAWGILLTDMIEANQIGLKHAQLALHHFKKGEIKKGEESILWGLYENLEEKQKWKARMQRYSNPNDELHQLAKKEYKKYSALPEPPVNQEVISNVCRNA